MVVLVDSLCTALVDMACFLELSGSEVVDADAAVAAMEGLGATLLDAPPLEKQTFLSACHCRAERLLLAGHEHSSEFVRKLPAVLGLMGER